MMIQMTIITTIQMTFRTVLELIGKFADWIGAIQLNVDTIRIFC